MILSQKQPVSTLLHVILYWFSLLSGMVSSHEHDLLLNFFLSEPATFCGCNNEHLPALLFLLIYYVAFQKVEKKRKKERARGGLPVLLSSKCRKRQSLEHCLFCFEVCNYFHLMLWSFFSW